MRGVLADMVELLARTHIADIKINKNLYSAEAAPASRAMFCFEVALDEPFERTGRDEKYAAQSYYQAEEEFFEVLRHGPREGS